MRAWVPRIAVALAAALAVGASPATAATAAILDPPGDAVTATDVTSVDVVWDGATLTLGVTATAPALTSLEVLVSESVSLRDPAWCAAGAPDTLAIEAGSTTGRLTATGLPGGLEAPATWTGSTVSYVFSSPDLVDALEGRDPFTCLSGAADGDTFLGAFDGKLLRIAPRAATDALARALSRRFGAKFDRARRPWLACPRQQIEPETSEVYASIMCRFEFRSGGRYRGGSLPFALVSGTLDPGRLRSSTYTKAMHGCRVASTKDGLPRRLRVTDRSLRGSRSFGRGCRWLAGRSGPAGALQQAAIRRYPRPMPARYAVVANGAGAAGFGDLFRFDCRVGPRSGRYAFRCRNALGDRFVFAFRISQKPKPRPAPPPPSQGGGGGCDPNYSGACLDPNASDYDCAGGSGDGPLYVQGPVYVVGDDHYGLDSDGDGVACET